MTLQKKDQALISIPFEDKSVDELLSKEWLLTNERGGYSSSTILGCNTRRYHGLLVGSLNPPTSRIMALAGCLEMMIFDKKLQPLSAFEFKDKFAPGNFDCIKSFRQDVGVHFDYETNDFEMTKSVYLLRDTDTVALVYDFKNIRVPAEFVVRPFVSLRDFHSLQHSYAPLCAKEAKGGLLIHHDTPGSCKLFLKSESADFENDPQWWFNFLYRVDKERGQDFTEDLWTPGFFKQRIDSPCKIVLWASFKGPNQHKYPVDYDIDVVRKSLAKHQKSIISAAKCHDKKFKILCAAADKFVTKRKTGDGKQRSTILAGFPWFADWGRDAFISLPGLLLATGRFAEAKSVLTTFAKAADKGLIPNRFDDRSDTAYFNSIDASLWFIIAAFQYLYITKDSSTFTRQLLPTIRWIIDSYYQGTHFGIHADTDELITAGDVSTQLTWMDAKCDGVAFTPRYGKTVEINALWYNAIRSLQCYYSEKDEDSEKHFNGLGDRVGKSFCKLFWNKEKGYLNDCVLPDGSVDDSLRPNQIYAVSLDFSPLTKEQQEAVVRVVEKNLLTPYGLRTLEPKDSRYNGTYTGGQFQRDKAYHQGTVWAYLIGAFVKSYLKINGFNAVSKRKAAEFIEPLMLHLEEETCIGNISEIFDGDAPHQPRGCIAQAWSVGELIIAYKLINE